MHLGIMHVLGANVCRILELLARALKSEMPRALARAPKRTHDTHAIAAVALFQIDPV